MRLCGAKTISPFSTIQKKAENWGNNCSLTFSVYLPNRMRIVPAIDVIDGHCVRLSEGDFSRKVVYNEDPLEVALAFEDAGLKYLHLVDLDGARDGQVRNWRVLEKLAHHTQLRIDFSGGLKSDDDLRTALECGARQLVIGSLAVQAPEVFRRWIDQLGAEVVVLSADVRGEALAVKGWQQQTQQTIIPFLNFWQAQGIAHCICTDIGQDGLLQGPGFALYRKLRKEVPQLRLVASGGIRSRDELLELKTMGMEAAIVGKALYEGIITPQDLSQWEAAW